MAQVVVEVMPKPAILDPQGRAIAGALDRLGHTGITDVRQGKRFVLEVDGAPTEERLAEIRQVAESLLANTVIEDYVVRVEGDEAGSDAGAGDRDDLVGEGTR